MNLDLDAPRGDMKTTEEELLWTAAHVNALELEYGAYILNKPSLDSWRSILRPPCHLYLPFILNNKELIIVKDVTSYEEKASRTLRRIMHSRWLSFLRDKCSR